jgi:hypothetical protein
MSDAGSEADSISDAINTHSCDDDGDADSSISPGVRVLCVRLRANDPGVLDADSGFVPLQYQGEYSEGERIEVFQALKENNQVKHIRLWLHGYTKISAEAATKYLESSKTLLAIDLCYGGYYQEFPKVISLLLQALSRNTSVAQLFTDTESVRFASVAFQEFLTRTQTLQTLEIVGSLCREINEVDISATTSGFANNTTLRYLKFQGWRAADLAPVLTALQDHPGLRKIHLAGSIDMNLFLSRSGLEVLLRSHDSKIKELVLERINTSTVGLHPVMRELARNTQVTSLAIRDSMLSRENVQ